MGMQEQTLESMKPEGTGPDSRAGTDAKASATGKKDRGTVEIPVDILRELVRKPFSKRHPVLFFLIVAACVAAAGVVITLVNSREKALAEEPTLALVEIRGPIMDVSGRLAWLDRLRREEKVVGVLVRVDSPGGGASASQELYDALAALAKTKPVAVSMGSTAASGGLMVSMAGRRVFANASTVTGSIGVRMDIPQVQRLMETLGLGKETLTTAPYKDAGSPMRPLSPAEREYLEGVLRDMHEQFVDIVARGRSMDRARAAELADGRIFTGRRALELGLVDELGGMDAAQDWLCRETGVDRAKKLLRMPDSRSWLSRQLGRVAAEAADALIGGLEARLKEIPAERSGFMYRW